MGHHLVVVNKMTINVDNLDNLDNIMIIKQPFINIYDLILTLIMIILDNKC